MEVTSWGGKLTRQLDKLTNQKKCVLIFYASFLNKLTHHVSASIHQPRTYKDSTGSSRRCNSSTNTRVLSRCSPLPPLTPV